MTTEQGSSGADSTTRQGPGNADWRARIARATEFVTFIDGKDRLSYVSRPEQRIDNYEGMPVYSFVPPQFRDALRRALKDSRASGLPEHYECEAAGPNGETSHYSSWVFPIGEDGSVAFVSIDISDQRRMATALERSETWLRALIDQAPDYILVAGRDRRIEFMNRPPHVGFTLDEVVGQRLESFLPKEDQAASIAAIERVFTTGESSTFRTTVEGPTGRMHVSARLGPIRLGETVDRVMLVSRDITAQREAEELAEQLRQSQKLEAIGKLTGGIAHDFNNLLTAIGGNLELIGDGGSTPEEVQELAEEARNAVERAAELTSRLLVFSRKQALKPQLVHPNTLLGGMVSLLRRTLGERFSIRTEFAESLALCQVDPTQLETAILNLCVNARDAMSGGGELVLATRAGSLDDSERPSVILEVRDSGTGMPPDVLTRACEPFFTTKDVGKGSGLGLSMVYGFVQQSGGTIDIQSKPGEGTAVTLHLPAATESTLPPPIEAEPVHVPAGGGARILVVEDQEQVAEVARKRLRRWGYEPTVVGTASAALKQLAAAPFQLLFSDLGLPGGMDGSELARQALKQQPQLAVLLATGYPPDQVASLGALPAGVEVLGKPYDGPQLGKALARALKAAPNDDPKTAS